MVSSISSKKRTKTCCILVKTNSFIRFWKNSRFDNLLSKLTDLLLKTDWKRMFLYKWPLYDLFWPLFGHMYLHLPQNWGSDGHFEELNKSNLWLVQNLWHKTQIFPFLFLLRFCTKTDICLFCVFCVLVFFVITFVPIKI